MKIGIDCRLWNQTGVGRYIQNLVINLEKIDEKNDYILFVRSEDIASIRSKVSHNNFVLKKADVSWHSVAEQIKLPFILNKEAIDLMHFPYFSVPMLYKKPFVMTMHDMIINQVSTGKASTKPFPLYRAKRLAYNTVVLSALKRARKIIVPTVTVKNELLLNVKIPQETIEVTYEGSSFEGIKPKTVSNLNIDNLFLYVGNAYPHKNLERLIGAFQEVLEKHPDIKLVLVGKEDFFYKRLREEVRKRGLLHSVIFTGAVSDEELAHLYKQAEALIMPSLMEGFGLTTIEAMSMNCMVIASAIPVLQEVCDNAALYFNPEDREDIKSKLLERLAMKKTEVDNYRKKGTSRVQLFSWQKMAEKTLKVYESSVSV